MKKKIMTLLSLILLFGLSLSVVSCNKKTVQPEVVNDIYDETILLNGFDTIADMYKVRQHTYVKNDKWTGYSAEGKLQIVGQDNFLPQERQSITTETYKDEDLAPRQGEGALYIHYASNIAEAGGFTQLIARFSNTDFQDLPVERLSKISLQIYNDNSQARKVTVSLVKSDLSVVSFGEKNSVELEPYAWTDCSVELNPAIVKYFCKDIVGLSVEFDDKQDCVYYLDNLCLTFEPVYTEEIQEYLDLVKELEEDIQAKVTGKTITLELKEVLSDLYGRYLALPEEYRGIVSNYTDLETSIKKYLSMLHDEEFKAKGEVSLLRFDEIFGLTQITDAVGCRVSYTTQEHAPGESGSICVEFDGTENWAELILASSGISYDEVRVWVKNDSEFARIVQLTWTTLAATGGTAYDEEGNEITNDLHGVDQNNNIIGKGGWIQLVWRDSVDMTSFQFSSYDVGTHEIVKCQGKLYIGKVMTVSKVGELMKCIDTIEEKESYSEKELVEIFDVYYAISKLTKELKNVLGLERTEKIERIYAEHADNVLNAKIKTLKVKEEYSAKEIKEIEYIATLYEALSKTMKQNVKMGTVNWIRKVIEHYNKSGVNMDVTAYDSFFEEELYFSSKETYSGARFSVKYAKKIENGNNVTVTLPEMVTGAKKLKIAIKNTSDTDIAFWPKVTDEQGGTWMEATNHGVIITKDEGWVELVYDIQDLNIEALIATYGPWENGNLSFYIGKIEMVTDISEEVCSMLEQLSSLFDKEEFTASEMRQILDVKEMYDSLSVSEKNKVDVTGLNQVLKKLSGYDDYGNNLNVVAYDVKYTNVLAYSLKEGINQNGSSMKITSEVKNKDAVTVTMPETIQGKKLTITLKNTSDKDIAFWPRLTESQGGTWLNPSNHNGDPVIKASEGWVELSYDITNATVDAWVATYGPWENGTLNLYVGEIEVTDSNLSDVKKELDNLSVLKDKEEFSAVEINQILTVQSIYEELSATEKQQLDVTQLNALLEKIKAYDTAGDNQNVVKYDNSYGEILYYSVKEVTEGGAFSLKIDTETTGGEVTLVLPKAICGAKILRITVKNVSDKPIAFWPKLPETQGGTWLNPTNNGGSPEIMNGGDWVELEYDISDMTIDALVSTYGPWTSGELNLYIGKLEVETTYLEVVQAAIDEIADILNQNEFTAEEIKKILKVKDIYDNRLSESEKATFNATSLLEAVAKIEGYDTAGTNMNVSQYDNAYGDILYYSAKETVEESQFSLKWVQQVENAEAYVTLPENINGAKQLTIAVKNTSDADIAFWPKLADVQGGTWLAPMNHNGNPIIQAAEGWVELTYDVEDVTVDGLVASYGPWASGQIELYIGKIEVKTTYLEDVKASIDNIANIISQDEFTATQINEILEVKAFYDSKLSESEKETLNATNLLEAVAKIEGHDTAGVNMNVSQYDNAYGDILYYSAKEKVEGSQFSLKWEQQAGTGESHVTLPESITGAKQLTFAVKNTSDKDVAFWPKVVDVQGGTWLAPTNHNGNPIIQAAEGWVELTYDVEGVTIDEILATYGPWASGQLELYIGKIEIITESVAQLETFNIQSTTGSIYSQTADGWKIDFNGTAQWCDVNFATVSGGQEIHIILKNDSEYTRIVSLDWQAASKVLDENGMDITSSIVNQTNTVLPAHSGWLEVIYPASSAGQLNCISLDSQGEPIASVGSLYIKGYKTE